MYRARSVCLNGAAQAVAASQTAQVLTIPFGLTAEDSLYFLARLKLSAAVLTNAITFKLQHAAGDGVWTPVGSSAQVSAVQKTCTHTDADAGADTFVVTTHGFSTGDRVLLSTSGTLPTGLTAGEYWVIRVDADTIQLAASQALALAGTASLFSAVGSGTFRFAQADYTCRLLATDSTDVAQLPLWSIARWVVDTGADDTCTVSEVWVTNRS